MKSLSSETSWGCLRSFCFPVPARRQPPEKPGAGLRLAHVAGWAVFRRSARQTRRSKDSEQGAEDQPAKACAQGLGAGLDHFGRLSIRVQTTLACQIVFTGVSFGSLGGGALFSPKTDPMPRKRSNQSNPSKTINALSETRSP
jgi:hypothetical protein